jgi:superfamily II DNA or RNA helicase
VQSLDHLLNLFSPALRERGRSYQRQGRVRLVRSSPQQVEAQVRGSQVYDVGVERTAEGWGYVCSCPAHADRGRCKHVCAAIWELKARGHAMEPPPAERTPASGSTARAQVPRSRRSTPASSPRMDQQIERLLAELTLPREEESALRSALGLGRTEIDFGTAPQRPPSGARVLADLATCPPCSNTGAVNRRLRYVIRKILGEPELVELTIEAARISSRGLRDYRLFNESLRNVVLDSVDASAAAVLIEGPRGSMGYRSSYASTANPCALQPELQRWLLPRLAGARRLWLQAPGQAPALLEPEADGPWRFRLDARRSGKHFELKGALERRGERIPCSQLDLVLAGGFAVAASKLLEVEWHGSHAWAARLQAIQSVQVPLGQSAELTRVLALAPAALPIDAPELVEELGGAPRCVLNVLKPIEGDSRLQARIEFEYGGERLRRGGSEVVVKAGRVLRVRRDAAAEGLAEEQFAAAGGRLNPASRDGQAEFDGEFLRRRISGVVRALQDQGWLVEGEGKALRTSGSISMSVRSGVDWFDVTAQIEFDGANLELPALLEAVAARQSLVRFSDGSYGLLPEQWLAQWAGLKTIGELDGQTLRVKRTRGFLLDTLLAEGEGIEFDRQFRELRQRLAQAKAPRPASEPRGFRGELRPYQREGLGWLQFLSEIGLGGCLADDMGLGKTVMFLALILARRERAGGPSLVVAPKSLLFNWEGEAFRFAPELQVHRHHGPERDKQRAALEDADLVLTTYGTLRQDFEFLKDVPFDLVALDEAQAIKSPSSQSAKAARLLRCGQRFALTGTPVENRIEDLLSIFEFLNPGMLEGSRALRGLLAGGDEVATARLAAKALGPFLLRRTKEQVLTELPAKTEQLVSCELEGAQRREYETLRRHYRDTLLAKVDEVGMAKASMNVLEALLRLRQAACHLALIDDKHARTASAKLETLLEMLEELRESGHKALVFSQFTSFLALVRASLEERKIAYEYLDGQTRDRETRVGRFQNEGGASVFLVSLKAGGVGLNLTAADYVFLLDPWWNPAVERQAIDRTHRIGQTRSVTAYRLVARDTVEEKVLALQEHKRAVADALFEGSGRSLRELTRADLEALLS